MVAIEAGELRSTLERLDLCLDCGGAFAGWLREGRQDGPGEAIGAKDGESTGRAR